MYVILFYMHPGISLQYIKMRLMRFFFYMSDLITGRIVYTYDLKIRTCVTEKPYVSPLLV